MLSPINYHNQNINDFLTINPGSNRHHSNTKVSKVPEKSINNNLLRLIQINPLKSSDSTISRSNKKKALTQISNIKFIPKRFANMPSSSMELPLKFIGKSRLDCNKLFGTKISTKEVSDNIKEKSIEKHHNKEINVRDNMFRNEYIYKFSSNSNNFIKLEKYVEFISSENQNNFLILFSKLKEALKKQSLLFFKKNDVIEENAKSNDMSSGFNKHKNDKSFSLPKIKKGINSQDETEEISSTEPNILNEKEKFSNHKLTMEMYQLGVSFNRLLTLILNDLRDCKYSNKKLNQQLTEYEIKLANNNKEIESMKKFLNKYEVSSKIYLKIKNEKELDKVISSFNKKENKYILSIFKLEEEIKTLTSLLENNQKYYHKCKDLEKDIEAGKKKNEELKFMFNQELHEKNLQKAIEKETEEDLLKKMENMKEIIEDLKKEADKRRKNDIENQIKIKKLLMTLDEKKENIVMLNEELEWYIMELNRTKNDLENTKIDLRNLETAVLNKINEQEKEEGEEKEKESISNESEGNDKNKKRIDESESNINNNNNYSFYNDKEKEKEKSNSEIPPINFSLINSPKS